MSSEIMEARKQWNNIFKIENDGADQPRILYQEALPIKVKNYKEIFRQVKAQRFDNQTS